MKLSEALEGIRRLYVETAPLIYYVEENQTYVAAMHAIFEAVEKIPIEVVSSVLTLKEVLVQPLKQGNNSLEQEYRDILLHSRGFRLHEVTAPIAESAARLRAQYNLRTPDAIHVATALDSGCGAFLTNDAAIRRVKELAVLLLDELEADLPESA